MPLFFAISGFLAASALRRSTAVRQLRARFRRLGFWGVLARYVRKESRVLRYLSDASFWIYLVHIPFLVALQSSLSTTELAIPVRWGLAVSGTLALAIGTYALIRWVRKLATKHVRPRGAPG